MTQKARSQLVMEERKAMISWLKARLPQARQSLFFVVIFSTAILAWFLLLASLILVSNPSSSIPKGTDHVGDPSLVLPSCQNLPGVPIQWQQPSDVANKDAIMGESESATNVSIRPALAPAPRTPVSGLSDEEAKASGDSSFVLADDSRKNESEASDGGSASLNLMPAAGPSPSPPSSDFSKDELRSCDLYRGRWAYDPAGPLYTNTTCPSIVEPWNCQGNGRPDSDYQSWRWKPDQCDLPRFDAWKFLQLMRGKSLALIGDSLARNTLESMLCLLSQAEVPRRVRNPHHLHQWLLKTSSTTITFIWSAWLVHTETTPLPSAPSGVLSIHLDTPDNNYMQHLPQFDVVVLSCGHWYFKHSAYLLRNKTVGGHLWKSRRPKRKQIDILKAYATAIETVVTAVATRPGYRGLTVLRSYSPDHNHAGGSLRAGDWCGWAGKPGSRLLLNDHSASMYRSQMAGYERGVKKLSNGSKMRLMNVTEAMGYRPDGHPGPYTRPGPVFGRNGKPLSKDCGHWCLPGPVDTWNELLLEVIRREL